MNRTPRPVFAVISALLTSCMSSGTLAGGGEEVIREWIGSGAFQAPRNWLDKIVPSREETARIAPVISTSIDISERDVRIGRMVVDRGAVRLLIFKGTLDVGSSDGGEVLIGSSSSALLELGTIRADRAPFTAGAVRVGTPAGPGTITGFFSARLFAEDDIVVGGESTGLLIDIVDLQADSLLIGDDASGAATRIQNVTTEHLTIGLGDDGLLDVGVLQAGSMTLGTQRDVSGHVVVTESATITGAVSVGLGGTGQFDVTDGATATIGGDLRVGLFADGEDPGTFDRSDGRICVLGPGARLSVGGDLRLGLLGHASMLVDSNARVTVGGALSVLDVPGNPDRVIEFLLAPPDDLEPILSAAVGLMAPRIEVRFNESMVPKVGDTWVLAESDGAFVRGPLLLETPGPGLRWTVLEDGNRLIVRLDSAIAPSADIDGDGTVGLEDLLIVLSSFGPCPAGDPCPADLDGNGAVDFLDLVQVLGGWSEPAP